MSFYENLNRFEENIALITEDEQISYVDLQNEIFKLRKYLEKRKLAFCLCDNNIESIVGYLSFLQNDVVVLLINVDIKQAQFENLLQTYRPHYIWSPKGFYKEGVFAFKEYELIITEFQHEYDLNPELGLLLTTSGSTGSPKLVRISYKNINSNAEAIAQYLNICKFDRPITTLPMSYTYGLSIINSHILKGASIVLTNETIIQKKFWDLLRINEATTFGGVPYTYEMLKRLHFFRMDLPSLRILTQAGGKLGADLHLEFAKECSAKGIKFIVMYGQTEATARMSYVPEKYALSKAGSIGIAIPGGEFRLIDENRNIIDSPDITGELVYLGENVTMGYAQSFSDLSKGDENKGILYTGDMAKCDSDGFYYIEGRKKRFLKIFGNRVNLDELEILLNQQGLECVCAGVDDCLKVFVTRQENLEIAQNYIINQTGINAKGFKVFLIDRIPRNEANKILYGELEKII